MSDPEVRADTDAAAANAARILEFFAAVLGPTHDTARLDGFLAAEFVDHDAASGDSGSAGVCAKLVGLWSVLSDGHYVPLQVVAAGDLVTVRSGLVAPAASRAPALSIAFADTYRMAGGMIAEHWHVVDADALAQAVRSRM